MTFYAKCIYKVHGTMYFMWCKLTYDAFEVFADTGQGSLDFKVAVSYQCFTCVHITACSLLINVFSCCNRTPESFLKAVSPGLALIYMPQCCHPVGCGTTMIVFSEMFST